MMNLTETARRWITISLLVAVTGCRREQPVTMPASQHRVFKCVQAYEGMEILGADGKRVSIEFADQGDKQLAEALLSLKPSIRIGCSPTEAPEEARMYFVGELTDDLSKPSKSDKPDSSPIPWTPRRLFRLKGWIIRGPYLEFPQEELQIDPPKPVTRTSLEASDFTAPLQCDIHHDAARGIWWLGEEPPNPLPESVGK